MQLIIGPEAITSYRRLAYTPWHAIAEFVDNSTQSYFDNRTILDEQMQLDGDKLLEVSIVYDRDDDMLRVTDNAMGMSVAELEQALHIARPPANTSGRSKYGMGMKTAACWIGNKWTITTKRLGESFEQSVTVNVNRVANGEANAVVHKEKAKAADLHYTIVEIIELNRIFQGRTLGKIGEFLRSMYRSDLEKQILKLRWRDQLLTWDSMGSRLLLSVEGKKYRKNFDFEVDNKRVHGWVGILDKGSRADAGFSILQAERVVKGWPDAWRPSSLYGQIQGSNNLVNQRLVGEIHLDGFDVSHTKDSILWRDNQEEKVEDGLKEKCGDYRDFAEQRRKKGDDQRGPSELDVKAALDDLERELSSPEMVDQINITVIPSSDAIDATNGKILRSVVSTRSATLQGTIASTPEINWSIFLENMSPYDPYVVSDSTKESEVTVIVNISHPYWSTQLEGTESVRDYLRQCIYDSVAEWQARSKASRIDSDTVKMLKDKLLRVPLEMELHGDETEDMAVVVDN
ncbi:MAG: ATP-binding protein [Actinomycetia bacterium]|nr:ATP-binding protein [Actinomycetes bacterium]